MKPKTLIGVAGTLFLAFIATIVASGAGWNPFGRNWDFSRSGQFGDSFGFLSSFMAAAAAFAAWSAYRLQSEEVRHLRDSASATQALEHKRDFEQTFFNLIGLFRDVLKEIDIRTGPNENREGREALVHILGKIMKQSRTSGTIAQDVEAQEAAFQIAYASYRDKLSHYFRLFYHLVKFVDEASVGDKRLYFRLVRGTLSDTEMVLIGLDCMYGGGRKKLKTLVERHGLLHNVSETSIEEWGMAGAFHPSAFGDRSDSASAAL
jgi:hypothetical protein